MAAESATLPSRHLAMESEPSAVSAMELISPFKSCIDYFECISTGSPVTEDRELLLVKLYVQMERFLTWGHISGFTKIQAGNTPQKLETKKVAVLASLNELQELISEATELEKKYGLQQDTEESTKEPPNYIGRRRARKTRKALAPAQDHSKEWVDVPAERTKWTICDNAKFELLIEDVTALVNDLHDSVPIKPLKQQSVMVCKDIERLDTHSLELVRDACDDPYPEWSNKAYAHLEASEVETQAQSSSVKQPNWSEWDAIFNLHEATELASPKSSQRTDVPFPPLELPGLQGKVHIYFIYTPSCSDRLDNEIGSKAFLYDGDSFFASSENITYNTKWSPTRRIADSMKLKFSPGDEEMIRYPHEDLIDAQQALLEQRTPLAYVYIYCPPCVCAIRTAFAMCQRTQSRMIRYQVRVDDRIDASCCLPESHPERLRSLLDAIKIAEAASYPKLRDLHTGWIEFVDRLWLEQRIYTLDDEKLSSEDEAFKKQRPGTFADAERFRRGKELFKNFECDFGQTRAFVILGSLGRDHWWMKTSPFNIGARKPRHYEIHHFSRLDYSANWKKDYLGTCTPSNYDLNRDHALLKKDKSEEAK